LESVDILKQTHRLMSLYMVKLVHLFSFIIGFILLRILPSIHPTTSLVLQTVLLTSILVIL